MTDLNVWAKRPEPHYSPETRCTRCDNCPDLYCIRQDKSMLHPWMYYCDAMKRKFTYKELYSITEEECPRGRPLMGRGRR